MIYNITLNNKNYKVEIERGDAVLLDISDQTAAPVVVAAPAETAAETTSALPQGGGTNVCSPLPGMIVSIKVSVGSVVKAGQVLAVIEAMKMENEIPSPKDGTVKAVLAAQGQNINTGDALVVLE